MTAYAYHHPWIGIVAGLLIMLGFIGFIALLSSGGRDG